METLLNELQAQLARTASRELDRRLIWDIVCAHGDGAPFKEMAIGEWPDGSKSIIKRAGVGEVPEVLGPRRKVDLDFDRERVRLVVS